MSCNTSRSNCTPESVFAASAPQGLCGQFVNPSNFQAEQLVYDVAYRDLINNFGVPINYYVNTFNMLSADLIYGEQPTAQFAGPYELQMYIELSENAINLSKFGFASDDELTGFLHIETFTSVMGSAHNYSSFSQLIEPKSGDIIELTSLGCDRPNGRGPKWFEITERVDQDVSSLNPMQGHYIYRVKAKRYERSFEPGIIGEEVNEQVSDNLQPYTYPVSVNQYINSILLTNAGASSSNGLYTRLSGGYTGFNGPNGNSIGYAYGIWRLSDSYYEDTTYTSNNIEDINMWAADQGTLPLPTAINTYSTIETHTLLHNIDNISQTEVFDMGANNTDIYGTYY